MIHSYFFIPGNHPRLIEKLHTIEADHLIIDLEDAIEINQLEESLTKIKQLEYKNNLWVRPRLFDNNKFNNGLLKELLIDGFSNFLIPKLENISQLRQIEDIAEELFIDNINLILLVENPQCLMNIQQILHNCKLKITGIGFGSQDYCTITGMSHTCDLLRIPRFIISNTAKAFNIDCIDIACMDIHGGDIFKTEIYEALLMGYNAKFIIHPDQLKTIKSIASYSPDQVKEAIEIVKEFERQGKPAVFVFNGRAIEPPHISYFLKIINLNQIENGN